MRQARGARALADPSRSAFGAERPLKGALGWGGRRCPAADGPGDAGPEAVTSDSPDTYEMLFATGYLGLLLQQTLWGGGDELKGESFLPKAGPRRCSRHRLGVNTPMSCAGLSPARPTG